MSQMILNMAKHAVNDPSLMAVLIDHYSRQTGKSWAELAAQLQISPTQLGKLALCRQPNGNSHREIQKIADYVNINSVVLRRFYDEAVNPPVNLQTKSSYQPGKTVHASQKKSYWQGFSTGSRFMAKKQFWAAGLVLFLILVVSAFVVAQPTAVSEATLIVNNGEVVITRAGSGPLSSAQSYTAVSGEAVVVTAGDTVTTGATATAQLHLTDGGSVDLFEATSVEITELVTTEETYQVTLTMLAGRTLNRVVHLLGVDDHYEVRSPSSAASVRGTIFTVDVLSQESTYVAVDEGIVNVTMGDQSVDVKAGFEVTAVFGELLIVKPQSQPPSQPAPAPTEPAPEPTATDIPAIPTKEPVPTPEPTLAAYKAKAEQKAILDITLVPRSEPIEDLDELPEDTPIEDGANDDDSDDSDNNGDDDNDDDGSDDGDDGDDDGDDDDDDGDNGDGDDGDDNDDDDDDNDDGDDGDDGDDDDDDDDNDDGDDDDDDGD